MGILTCLNFPRIENVHAEAREVPDVARDHRKVMFNSGRRDHTVCRVQRRPPQLALAVQYTPSVSDGRRHGQNAVAKPYQQVRVEPRFKLGAAPARRQNYQTLSDLANGNNADEKRRRRLRS